MVAGAHPELAAEGAQLVILGHDVRLGAGEGGGELLVAVAHDADVAGGDAAQEVLADEQERVGVHPRPRLRLLHPADPLLAVDAGARRVGVVGALGGLDAEVVAVVDAEVVAGGAGPYRAVAVEL